VDHSPAWSYPAVAIRGKPAPRGGAIGAEAIVPKPLFVVPLADLERGAKAASWPIPVSWLERALEDVEATPAGADGLLEVELIKNGNEVLVRGRAEVSVTVPCVVTLEPLPFRLTPDIFLMLSPAPGQPATGARAARRKEVVASGRAAGGGRSGTGTAGGGRAAAGGRSGRGARNVRKAGPEAWDDGSELTPGDAARDHFEGDKIVLDEFLREFIVLELPMYPRRSDLPLDESPATGTPLPPSPSAGLSDQAPVDPRLLPLAEIRDRLRQTKKE